MKVQYSCAGGENGSTRSISSAVHRRRWENCSATEQFSHRHIFLYLKAAQQQVQFRGHVLQAIGAFLDFVAASGN